MYDVLEDAEQPDFIAKLVTVWLYIYIHTHIHICIYRVFRDFRA